MGSEKILTVRPAALDDDALAAFAPMMRFDTSGGLCSLEDHLSGSNVFAVELGGAVVAHYALALNLRAHGAECVIVGAAGRLPGFDLTASVLPYIEAQAFAQVGARAVKVETRRKALANKLMAMGYALDGLILRKRRRDD